MFSCLNDFVVYLCQMVPHKYLPTPHDLPSQGCRPSIRVSEVSLVTRELVTEVELVRFEPVSYSVSASTC